jgi:hypothetical protein
VFYLYTLDWGDVFGSTLVFSLQSIIREKYLDPPLSLPFLLTRIVIKQATLIEGKYLDPPLCFVFPLGLCYNTMGHFSVLSRGSVWEAFPLTTRAYVFIWIYKVETGFASSVHLIQI